MAKLVDALALGASGVTHGGSSPLLPTVCSLKRRQGKTRGSSPLPGTFMMILLLKIVALVILLILLFLSFLWIWTSLRATVPFIPVSDGALEGIDAALEIMPGSVVYDLGCGDARVLIYLAKRHPDARFVGIENGAFPLLVARLRVWRNRKALQGRVKIINGNFFSIPLSDATHVFAYLFGSVLDELLPKLQRELRPGARLVSAAFVFSGKQPVRQIALGGNRYRIAKELHVYEF